MTDSGWIFKSATERSISGRQDSVAVAASVSSVYDSISSIVAGPLRSSFIGRTAQVSNQHCYSRDMHNRKIPPIVQLFQEA